MMKLRYQNDQKASHSTQLLIRASSYTEKPKSYKTGSFTCCVPQCYNNSKVNKDLSFYVIPKHPELRKKWLHKISCKNFNPTTGHRVCSVHFEGGKKTYTNSVPTIVLLETVKA